MIFVLAFFLIFSSETEQNVYKLSLSSAIQRMLQDNFDIKAGQAKIYVAKSKLDQARSNRLPSVEGHLNFAPIPKISGDFLDTDRDWDTWGTYFNIGAKIVQPLSTFGLLDAYIDAANSNLDLESSKFDLKKNDLVFFTKQYYYSLQLANDLCSIVEDGKKKFDEAIKTSEDLLLKNKIKKEDIFQLNMSYATFMNKYLEAYRKRDLVTLAFKSVLAIPLDKEIELDENSIIPVEVELEDENKYLALSLQNRPELKMLDSGLNALESLWKVEEKKKLPVFFTSLIGSVSHSNVIEDQHSAFLNDPYNGRSFAFVFGLKFKLDWWKNDPLINQAKYQYESLSFEKEYKYSLMLIELKKVFREFIDSKKNLDYAMDGEKNAVKWNFNVTLAYGFGNVKAKEMLDAIKGVLESKLYFNMAIYEYNMAVANLSKICGQELLSDIKY